MWVSCDWDSILEIQVAFAHPCLNQVLAVRSPDANDEEQQQPA
jgi:hypothetical protein